MLDKNRQPLVSVGIPTYNRPELLRRAIDSIVNQTYKNLEIIISDNATPSIEVETIVNKYLEYDNRIIFNRFSENYGHGINFEYVLNNANGKYFMFAADDDIKSLDFIEKNLQFLENNHDYVASISPARFEGDEGASIMGDNSLENEIPEKRVLDFLKYWHANARFSSLIELEPLKDAFDINDFFLGNDWYMIIKLLMNGKFKRIDEGEIIIGVDGVSNNNIFSVFRKRLMDWFFPFNTFSLLTYDLIKKNASNKILFQIIYSLLKLNMKAFIYQIKLEAKYLIQSVKR